MVRAKMLGKRILQIVIVLIGISFLSYLLITLAPGDAAQSMFTASGIIPTEEQLESLRDQMGLNDRFLFSMVRGCPGVSAVISAPPLHRGALLVRCLLKE